MASDPLPANPRQFTPELKGGDKETTTSVSSPDPVEETWIPDSVSSARRAVLLAIFCFALYTDAFMTSAMLICLPSIGFDFNRATNIVTWVMTAYSLTFGSFLLLAGRLSDIYHPKPVFIGGFVLLGALGLGGGFVKSLIPLIILRALQGIGAAMTIPSATAMLTSAYTTPLARGLALTAFAGAGTLGLSSGFVIGGIVVQFASWRWVLWIVPIIAFPLSAMSLLLIPYSRSVSKDGKRKMDFPGVILLTASIILLIFSLSQAPSTGWGTAEVIVPLVLSIAGFVAFFFWQTRLDDKDALIPSKMWFIPNFAILVFISLCTQIYLTGPVLIFSTYWPAAYDWSPLKIGLHILPMGISAVIVCVVLPALILKLPPRLALLGGTATSGLFSILFVFANTRERYWSYVFPAMVLITLGSTAAYIVSNVGIVTSVPPTSVGVASAIFSAAQQVGGAIHIAIITTIFVQIRDDNPFPSYRSAEASFWYLVALGLVETVLVVAFFTQRK